MSPYLVHILYIVCCQVFVNIPLSHFSLFDNHSGALECALGLVLFHPSMTGLSSVWQIPLPVLLAIGWSLRIFFTLLWRSSITGVLDGRFSASRGSVKSLAGFYGAHATWCSLMLLPVYGLRIARATPRDGDSIHLLMWGLGGVLAVGGDWCKGKWKATHGPDARSYRYNDAVWFRICRHPNYGGELMQVAAMAAAAVDCGTPGWRSLLAVASSVFILTKGVAANTVESRNTRDFGSDPDYWKWRDSTSPLLPVMPQVYRLMPRTLKNTIFMESLFRRWDKRPEGRTRS
jgi:steroid 5-alpha reductase family enzyme